MDEGDTIRVKRRLARIASDPWIADGPRVITPAGAVVAECETEADAELMASAPRTLRQWCEEVAVLRRANADLAAKLKRARSAVEEIEYHALGLGQDLDHD